MEDMLAPYGVAEFGHELLPGGVPDPEVAVGVDLGLPFGVRDGEAAAGRDGPDVAAAEPDLLDHRLADRLQVAVVHPRADVHVEPDEVQPVPVDQGEALGEVLVPDAVLALLAAGVGLPAVPVSEAWGWGCWSPGNRA